MGVLNEKRCKRKADKGKYTKDTMEEKYFNFIYTFNLSERFNEKRY